MKLYVFVDFPEAQRLMDNPRFNECKLIGSSTYICPKDLYDEIFE